MQQHPIILPFGIIDEVMDGPWLGLGEISLHSSEETSPANSHIQTPRMLDGVQSKILVAPSTTTWAQFVTNDDTMGDREG